MRVPRLDQAALARLDPARVALPNYDRTRIIPGVLHLGPGAFHRAHQAAFFDRLMAVDPRWAITGVSLRSERTKQALAPQDGLYTLAILDESVRFRIIGALYAVAAAGDSVFADALISPQTRLITLTVTEKGYCLGPDGALDFAHPDIVRDLNTPETPCSAVGWLVEGLRRRFAAGVPPPDILSCDNLPENGRKLRAAVIALAEARDRNLARRIAAEVRFPCCMVDAITPATDDALRERVRREAGVDDAWPVQREAFASWIIEKNVSAGFPDLAAAGAVMTVNVAAHEQAKLRMLNGAHSALAYLGLARGFKTVGEAMADSDTAALVEEMMRIEIEPGLAAPADLDLDDYRRTLLKRFRNPALSHRLAQIAWDGSQKLPIRLMGTIADNLAAGRPVTRLAAGVAAWMRFVRRAVRAGKEIVDPLSEELAATGWACRDVPEFDCAQFIERLPVVPEMLKKSAAFRAAVEEAYGQVMREEVRH